MSAKELKRLGWDKKDNESHLDTLLRPIIISMNAGADNETILKKIRTAYTEKIENGTEVPADIRGTIYSTIARHGGQTEFDQMLNLYKETHSSDEKLSLTAAMTTFEQPEIHEQVFDLIKSDTIKNQDISYWIAYSFMNRFSSQATWQWLQDNWQWMKDTVGSDLSFYRTPLYAARRFATPAFIEEFTTFFESVNEPALDRSYKQGLEILTINKDWHARDSKKAIDWFKSQSR